MLNSFLFIRYIHYLKLVTVISFPLRSYTYNAFCCRNNDIPSLTQSQTVAFAIETVETAKERLVICNKTNCNLQNKKYVK